METNQATHFTPAMLRPRYVGRSSDHKESRRGEGRVETEIHLGGGGGEGGELGSWGGDRKSILTLIQSRHAGAVREPCWSQAVSHNFRNFRNFPEPPGNILIGTTPPPPPPGSHLEKYQGEMLSLQGSGSVVKKM